MNRKFKLTMKPHYLFFALVGLIILGGIVFTEDQHTIRPYEDVDGVSYEDLYLGEDLYLPDKDYPGPEYPSAPPKSEKSGI